MDAMDIDTAVDEIMQEVEGYHAFRQWQGRALRDGSLDADEAKVRRAEELAAIRLRVRLLIEGVAGTPGAS